MEKRYFVDERVGCVAVRDSRHPEFDFNYPGLNSNLPDVVHYFNGERVMDGEKFVKWTVKEEDVKKCHELCDKLNS